MKRKPIRLLMLGAALVALLIAAVTADGAGLAMTVTVLLIAAVLVECLLWVSLLSRNGEERR